MSARVEIIKGNIVFFPENTLEAFGLEMLLTNISGESTNPESIDGRFEVCLDRILQEED